MMSLDELKGVGKVVALDESSIPTRRMISLGVYPGATVKVMRRGPFGNPIEVAVGGSLIAVRRDVGRGILVEVENG